MDIWRVGDRALAWLQVVLLFTTTFDYSTFLLLFQLPYTYICYVFSPVKLGLGQQRKKPEATAGLVSEMVLGATTWLVSWQREFSRGHVFFRFGGTLAF